MVHHRAGRLVGGSLHFVEDFQNTLRGHGLLDVLLHCRWHGVADVVWNCNAQNVIGIRLHQRKQELLALCGHCRELRQKLLFLGGACLLI